MQSIRSSENPYWQPHYVSVFVVGSKSGRYLLMRRATDHLRGNWQMVTGKIEPEEHPSAAALRELQEETGYQSQQFYHADQLEIFYDFRFQRISVAVDFVAFVDESQPPVLSCEHDQYEWCTYEETMEKLEFSEQRRVLSTVQKQFVDAIEPNRRFLI